MKPEAALGFAMRARKLISGDPVCEKAIKSNKPALAVVLDESASDNTREKYGRMCSTRDIPLFTLENMGAAIGKDSRIVAATCDAQFADLIIKAFGGKTASRANELAAQGEAVETRNS